MFDVDLFKMLFLLKGNEMKFFPTQRLQSIGCVKTESYRNNGINHTR